jgi:hypothetical protein
MRAYTVETALKLSGSELHRVNDMMVEDGTLGGKIVRKDNPR